jgi:hypothetical protein
MSVFQRNTVNCFIIYYLCLQYVFLIFRSGTKCFKFFIMCIFSSLKARHITTKLQITHHTIPPRSIHFYEFSLTIDQMLALSSRMPNLIIATSVTCPGHISPNHEYFVLERNVHCINTINDSPSQLTNILNISFRNTNFLVSTPSMTLHPS